MDREAYERLKTEKLDSSLGDERVASFLAGKFEAGEKESRSRLSEEPSWVYNIWTYHF
jgi:hypothetical protein